MFSLSQMTKVKLLCFGMARKLRQRQQFSDRYERENTRLSNAQIKHVMTIGWRRTRKGAAYRSTIGKEHGERRMPIDKQMDYAVEGKTEERKERLGMFGYKPSCFAAT